MRGGPQRDLTNKTITCPDGSTVTIRELVGSGATGDVYKCDAGGSTQPLAAKVIDVRKLKFVADFERERDKLKREIAILASLSHTGVVNLYGVIDTADWLVLLMDYVEGGELFNYVLNMGSLSEDQARFVFHQVAHTVSFLHTEGIIHRDLKLENILVCAQPAPGFFEVKVADFGLSKLITGGFTKARSYVGTPQYWAPEVIKAAQAGTSYSFEADIWSLGCLLYVMIGGTYPFSQEQNILDGSFHFRYPKFDDVSTSCLDLIRGMLKVNPRERLSLVDVLNHPWMARPWMTADVPTLPIHRRVDRAQIIMNVGPTIVGTKEANGVINFTPAVTPSKASDVEDAIVSAAPAAPPIPKKDSNFSSTVVTLFKTEMLLELLTRVFYRFHQAYLVFRCHDKLRSEFERMLFDLRDLTMEAQKVFKRFGVTCGSVLELIQDVATVVTDGSPELAPPMFDNLREWIVETKEDGINMRNRFKEFTRAAAALVVYSRDLDAPWTKPTSPEQAARMNWCALPASQEQCSFMLQDSASRDQRVTNEYSKERNSIFEQVEVVVEEVTTASSSSSSEHVARRLFDFVFVSPEVVPHVVAEAPVVEDMGETRPTSPPSAPAPTVQHENSDSVTSPVSEGQTTTIAAINTEQNQWEQKTRVLIQGVGELQRISDILEQCTAFWDNLDVTLGLLRKFRDQTVILLQCSALKGRDQDRFLARLKKYESFWTELSLQCSLFVEKSEEQTQNMRRFVEAFNESMVRANQLAALMQAATDRDLPFKPDSL